MSSSLTVLNEPQTESRNALPIVNQHEAKFECIYGRGCDGLCCRNGRPGLYPEEIDQIDANLDKFLPHLRPAARELIEEEGYLSRRLKDGLPMLRVVEDWCVFFHEGCVLHKVGAMEGDKYLYKPSACSLFPLTQDHKGRWYVRQAGYRGEIWDLFCLDPQTSPQSAVDNLQEEIALARKYEAEGAEEEIAEAS
jgi:hypothetical protein